ncbi:MAG TPA: hypothetical protein VFZ52_24295 [Chryseolinea sp.]
MQQIESFSLFAGIIGLILLTAGLYKPWIMLWWRERQNRRQVIKLYGTIALISFVIYTTLRLVRT